ncbi:hypothetical protein ACWGE0_29200 [Lentzea sp. NPDC054927]
MIRSHNAESHDRYELADSVAQEMHGFTAESAPDEMVVHGFRVICRTGRDAVIAEMVRRGPKRMRMTSGGA